MANSGYTNCACRDCFDVTVSDDMDEPELCSECEEAGCDCEGGSECCRDDAYGCDGDFEELPYADTDWPITERP